MSDEEKIEAMNLVMDQCIEYRKKMDDLGWVMKKWKETVRRFHKDSPDMEGLTLYRQAEFETKAREIEDCMSDVTRIIGHAWEDPEQ